MDLVSLTSKRGESVSKKRDKLRFNVFLASILFHSNLATCDRLHTACGIFENKRLRGIGYNGSVTGLPHCDDVDHEIVEGHCLRTRHGEKNAISNTPKRYLQGSEAIVIATPCLDCVKDLIHEGIKVIHYIGEYKNSKGKEVIMKFAKGAGVKLCQVHVDYEKFFQEMLDGLTHKGGVLWYAGYRLKVIKEPLIK